jgi:hypothetical protein
MAWLERLTVRRHAWLSPEDLEADPVRSADPRLPDVMRLAVTAILGLGITGRAIMLVVKR